MVAKDTVNVEQALAFRQEPYQVDFTNNDAILYALSVGFQSDPMNDKHYKFTYENAEDFQTFPTNASTLCHELVMKFL